MVTGASTADVAVILIDARKGVLTQTRRHSYLVSLLGIRHVVLAINKMDLVGYSQEVFDAHRATTTASSRSSIGLDDVVCIPMSALNGDNVTAPQRQHAVVPRPDADGATSRRVEVDDDAAQRGPFRMPVQWVNRPEPRLPRLLGPHRRRRRAARRSRARAAVGHARARSRASSRTTATCDAGGRRPVGHADARTTRSTSAAATCSRRPTRRRRWPTSSRRRSSG